MLLFISCLCCMLLLVCLCCLGMMRLIVYNSMLLCVRMLLLCSRVFVCSIVIFTLLDLCVSSLRRGHANLLCIAPILMDDPRRESASWSFLFVFCCLKVYHLNHVRFFLLEFFSFHLSFLLYLLLSFLHQLGGPLA